jgi:hypothetical protein
MRPPACRPDLPSCRREIGAGHFRTMRKRRHRPGRPQATGHAQDTDRLHRIRASAARLGQQGSPTDRTGVTVTVSSQHERHKHGPGLRPTFLGLTLIPIRHPVRCETARTRPPLPQLRLPCCPENRQRPETATHPSAWLPALEDDTDASPGCADRPCAAVPIPPPDPHHPARRQDRRARGL